MAIRDTTHVVLRVGPGNCTPSPHRSGREPLDSSSPCHPVKAVAFTAFHQDKEFLRFPVDPTPTWVTCSLCSTSITPFHCSYKAVRPWSSRRYFRPRGTRACAFSLLITDPVLKFSTKARIRLTPPLHWTPHDQGGPFTRWIPLRGFTISSQILLFQAFSQRDSGLSPAMRKFTDAFGR